VELAIRKARQDLAADSQFRMIRQHSDDLAYSRSGKRWDRLSIWFLLGHSLLLEPREDRSIQNDGERKATRGWLKQLHRRESHRAWRMRSLENQVRDIHHSEESGLPP